MNVLQEIANDITGVEILKDWLGDGVAVHPMVSEVRARICGQCSENVQPGWWERNLKLPVAGVIKAELELKGGMNLNVPNEADLGMCKVCGCCNVLAVHVPTMHLKAHTTQRLLDRYPLHCWKKIEIERLNHEF